MKRIILSGVDADAYIESSKVNVTEVTAYLNKALEDITNLQSEIVELNKELARATSQEMRIANNKDAGEPVLDVYSDQREIQNELETPVTVAVTEENPFKPKAKQKEEITPSKPKKKKPIYKFTKEDFDLIETRATLKSASARQLNILYNKFGEGVFSYKTFRNRIMALGVTLEITAGYEDVMSIPDMRIFNAFKNKAKR